MKWCFFSCFGALIAVVLAIILGAALDGLADGIALDPATQPLSPPEIDAGRFELDGYLLVRGLISGDMLREAQEAGHVESQRKHWLFDRLFKAYSKITFAAWQRQHAFARIAFGSAAPSIAAKLVDNGAQPLRILKDAFMAYEPGREGCGWHVDDKGFWPALDHTTGVNVWIALSPMRAAEGGGLAVAPGTHAAGWAECKAVISTNEDGGGPRTCDMERLSPDCHARLEERKHLHDMEPGDAIVLHRGTFHRSQPFMAGTGTPLHRYNVRYVPDSAGMYDNGFEAIFSRGAPGVGNGTAVSEAGIYYPQAWPRPLASELRMLEEGFSSEPSVALLCRSLLRKLASVWHASPAPQKGTSA